MIDRLFSLLGLTRSVSRLEYLKMMDELSSTIRDVERLIGVCARQHKKNEQLYWERKWEELVTTYMEFEWGLHPHNPTPAVLR